MIEKPVITKTQHYVWRVNSRFGVEHFAYIDAYNVIGFGGELLYGGHQGGSNVRSGKANCPTKSEARAFVAGWGYGQEYAIQDTLEGRTKAQDAARNWVKVGKIGINLRSVCESAYYYAALRSGQLRKPGVAEFACEGCGGTGFYAPSPQLGADACIDCGGSGRTRRSTPTAMTSKLKAIADFYGQEVQHTDAPLRVAGAAGPLGDPDILAAEKSEQYVRCYVCDRPMDGLSEDDCHCFHRKELAGEKSAPIGGAEQTTSVQKPNEKKGTP
jgi:hypothetical protein